MQHNKKPTFPRQRALAHAVLLACASLGLASNAAAEDSDATNDLGTIVVTGSRIVNRSTLHQDQAASVVTRRDFQTFNRDTVADALNLLPGVMIATNGRNEKTINVRGYDSRQMPIFVDGIPLYVPYDGYVDLGRFRTADLSAIQVAKGMSSMMYGPNAMGGAINLLTRKPTKPFEGDVRAGVGSGQLRTGSVNLGTRQDNWYLQAGADYESQDFFKLSGDFQPTAVEDGGHRLNSDHLDIKKSVKLGWLPREGDEYALGYVYQHGAKGQPPVTDPTQSPRYWRWPYWDKESVYLLSTTRLTGNEAIKLRVYHDTYANAVINYKDASYSQVQAKVLNTTTGESYYDDSSNGASAELSSDRLQGHTLKALLYVKRDTHRESDGQNSGATFRDDIHSFALEDRYALGEATQLVAGLSRDTLKPTESGIYQLPSAKSLNNAQLGLYQDIAAGRVYASIAGKSRLPTLKDRYSLRMGSTIENPDLQPERSRNYEIGFQGEPWANGSVDAAVFYSDIRDLIQMVSNVQPGRGQMQNVGHVVARGLELGLRQRVGQDTTLGGSYTLLSRDNRSSSDRLTGTPRNKLTGYADWGFLPGWHAVWFTQYESSRWSSNTVELGSYATSDLKLAWSPIKAVTVEAGASNLFDRNYQLVDGYPSPGRGWFVNGQYRF
ncbi:TonB-dependent receptor [Chitinivorax sp. PXF-14]|uniref:TonB-dependent receptor plug domain-containing protein n=1 Tax=Chitinivorax sp. PXF-14 TaxID=3230488 RepID=UPI003467285B